MPILFDILFPFHFMGLDIANKWMCLMGEKSALTKKGEVVNDGRK